MRRLWLATVLLALTACTQAPTSAPEPPPSGTRAFVAAEVTQVVHHPKIPKRPAAIPRSSEKYRVYAFARIHYNRTQMRCLDQLWIHESHWGVHAGNPASSYGIPQAYPGSKMRSAGPRWRDDGRTQVRWGLGYIRGRYGSVCAAWGLWQARFPHWY